MSSMDDTLERSIDGDADHGFRNVYALLAVANEAAKQKCTILKQT